MDDQLKNIIGNYRVLCDYCDGLWDKVRAAYPNEIACRNGCDICCELQSVNRLEAHVIKEYLDASDNEDGDDDSNISHDKGGTSFDKSYSNGGDPQNISHDDDRISSDDQNDSCGSCPFIIDHSCSIYPARPTICRTHGLVLRSTEFPHGQSASCPYNFPSIHPFDIPEDLTLDIDRITKNLTNLNLAFCMVTGVDIKSAAEERILLRDLRNP